MQLLALRPRLDKELTCEVAPSTCITSHRVDESSHLLSRIHSVGLDNTGEQALENGWFEVNNC